MFNVFVSVFNAILIIFGWLFLIVVYICVCVWEREREREREREKKKKKKKKKTWIESDRIYGEKGKNVRNVWCFVYCAVFVSYLLNKISV